MALFKIMKTKWIEVMIIVMALGLLSLCFAAWDNTRPGAADPFTDWPGLMGANWDALEVELGINLNETHPYYQSAAPTAKPDTSTVLDVDDNGRLWIDSDDNIVYILTDYSGPTWTEINPVLVNDTYFTSVDNAGTGTVDLIKANASDVAVLPDGSEMASSAAPTADAEIANKKYVDDHIKVLSYSYSVASGTAPSAASWNAWTKFPLNTEVIDTGNLGSLASNQITLAAGTYTCEASMPNMRARGAKLRLRDITGGTTLIIGLTVEAYDGINESNLSILSGAFTIGVESVLELQYYFRDTDTVAAFSNASSTGENEVYGVITLQKI